MHKFIVGALLFCSFEAHALQTYTLKDQQKTTVAVSKREANRISVQDDRIHQVFGVDDSYAVETDEQGGQIFLKSLTPVAVTPFTLTLVTEKGLTHDLRIKPQEIEAQSVLLKPAKVVKAASFQSGTQQELLDFIRDFAVQAERDDVYIDHHPKEANRENDDFEASVDFTYEDDTFKGVFFKIKNKQPYPLSIETSVIALPGDRAIAFKDKRIPAFGATKAYVVRGKS